jgi:hypothetical protein
MSIILATEEEDSLSLGVKDQAGQHGKTPSQKNKKESIGKGVWSCPYYFSNGREMR